MMNDATLWHILASSKKHLPWQGRRVSLMEHVLHTQLDVAHELLTCSSRRARLELSTLLMTALGLPPSFSPY